MARLVAPRLVTLCLVLIAAATAPAAAERTVTDAAGRTVTVTDASRIVAIGGAVTEILYALGAEDRIVAVDQTSTFPARTADKASVGYMRTLSPEGVLSIDPTLVLAIEGSGPRDAIDVLEKASVPFVLVPEAHDAEGVARKIRFIADAIGESARGEALADAVLADVAAFAAERSRIAERRKAVFVLSMGSGAPVVAGQHTAADAIFAVAGIDNALTGFNGYKAANDEATLGANPDAVVLMAERGHSLTPEQVFAAPAFAGTPAAQARRLVMLPGSYLLAFSPRIAHAARDLAAGVYPEIDFAPLPARAWVEAAPAP